MSLHARVVLGNCLTHSQIRHKHGRFLTAVWHTSIEVKQIRHKPVARPSTTRCTKRVGGCNKEQGRKKWNHHGRGGQFDHDRREYHHRRQQQHASCNPGAMRLALAGVGGCLLVAGGMAVAVEASEEASDTKVEHYTGLSFPSTKDIWTCSNDSCARASLTLMDVGVRCMMDMCFIPQARAYAVALYVNMDACQQHSLALSAHDVSSEDILPGAVTTADEDLRTAAFNRALMGSGATFDRAIVLCFDRHIEGKHMSKGMEKSLSQRLGNMRRGPQDAQHEDVNLNMRRLCRGFDSIDIQRGTEVVFSWTGQGDTLLLCVDGVVKDSIDCPRLAWAVFDLYLGPRPLSASAQECFQRAWEHTMGTTTQSLLGGGSLSIAAPAKQKKKQ